MRQSRRFPRPPDAVSGPSRKVRPLVRGHRHPSPDLVSLPRALSKLGFCSRTEASKLIEAGLVTVNGKPASGTTQRVDLKNTAITVDDKPVIRADKLYFMMNKPRGLITTRTDPQQRGTVYDCLAGLDLPFVSPVGRLDKASEGLLLMTNDTQWAERLLNPESNVRKHYHVQIDRPADDEMLANLQAGIIDKGERLIAQSAMLLRSGSRTSWIEVVLNEGKNRQIRRLIATQEARVERLVRVSIGGVSLGNLAKGAVRPLTDDERLRLANLG